MWDEHAGFIAECRRGEQQKVGTLDFMWVQICRVGVAA